MIAAGLCYDLSPWIAEVALAVEFADVPGGFGAYSVDGSYEVLVGYGVGGLLDFPEVFAESGDGGGGVEDDFGSVEAEGAGAFGEVAVVAEVDADFADGGFPDGVAEVAGAEVEFFPEAGVAVGEVGFAVFAEEFAVGVDEGGGVVVDAGAIDFVDGDDEDDAEALGGFHHELDGGAVGDGFGDVVPAGGLLGGEVGAVEELLEAEDLNAFFGGVFDHLHVLFDHCGADDGGVGVAGMGAGGLDEAASYHAHEISG